MDMKERIQQLNEMHGWTVYRLAKEARISPSTLSNMIRRGTSPSLATIERLCNAYGITLVQFFHEGEGAVTLTRAQREHLDQWNLLSDRQKKAVELFMKGLLQIG